MNHNEFLAIYTAYKFLLHLNLMAFNIKLKENK